ncbi:MAG: putative heme-binding domain-containing protein [Planctomycetaceae bacterium]
MLAAGNHRRGRALFARQGCAACHAVDGKTASLGPDLSKPENDKPLTRAEFFEAVNEPSKKIRKGYDAFSVLLDSGKVTTGRIIKETDEAVTMLVPTQTQQIDKVVIPRSEIDEIIKQPISVMPKGLLKGLRESQIADLLAYLETVSDPNFVATVPKTIPAKLPGVALEPEEADSTFYSPEESMKRIHLAPGYRLELVASEPMIEEPVLCVWDGNSRMYVAEMRTYMQDADGTDQDLPKSRVSMLEDTDGDGKMDKVSRFADNMVLPRMILPLDDRIIINETYTNDYYSYRDTDGDGVADEKELLYGGGRAGGNLEHQNSGLTWGIDNWIYTARTGDQRHRFIGGKWTSERLYSDNGQWGLAMDDVGRFFLSAAGGEKPAYGFQQLPHYGKLSLPGEREPDFEAVFPIVKMVDVQGGLGRVDKVRGGLNRFTGCAGQSIYRGDRMPADFNGDYILPEPVGRLVRRAKVTQIDGKYVLSNAYEDSEFIASTDRNFRPLGSATGPDGCLYIVDMYRGIIQEGNWTREGSYLRGVIDKEGFAKNIGRGRIYRVVHESTIRDTPPRMLDMSTAELVEQLSHPNGWRRDTAQKLIVLRGDKSVVPQLQKLVQEGTAPLGRMHAMWTLDGLGASTRQTAGSAIADADARVKLAAIRISEPLLDDDPELVQKVGEAGYDDDMTVAVQAINSLRFAKTKEAKAAISEIAGAYPESDLVMASAQSSLNYREGGGGPTFANFDADMIAKMQRGYRSYTMVCIRCHGPDAKGAVSSDGLQLAPSLVGSPRLLGPPEVSARILMHGLIGPVDGKKYPGVMESMKRQDDEWIASALTFVRNSFGNAASRIEARDVAKVRRSTSARTKPYTIEDFAAYQVVPADVVRSWKFTASVGANIKNAIDGDPETRFDTRGDQAPGQWFQFDMGQSHELTSLILDTSGSKNDFPRGYEVRFSTDGETFDEPSASGQGAGIVTSIGLPPGTKGRFVRIVQTGEKKGNYWSIHELSIFGRKSVPAENEVANLGRSIYAKTCLHCHGRSGAGRVTSELQALALPIDRQSDVVRNRDALIRIGLLGLVSKDASCPGFSSDGAPGEEQVAEALSYIRKEFHQGLAGITSKEVQAAIDGLTSPAEPVTRESLAEFLPISRKEMSAWKLTASHGSKDVGNAIDGNPNSRYTTGTYMKPGMWFAFDMLHEHEVRSILLDSTKSAGDYPRGYAVSTSENGADWSEPILTGEGTTEVTELALPAGTNTRHIRIEQTGEFSLFWSIHELQVFGQKVD